MKDSYRHLSRKYRQETIHLQEKINEQDTEITDLEEKVKELEAQITFNRKK